MHKPNFNKVLQVVMKAAKEKPSKWDQTWPHREDGRKCFGGFAQVVSGEKENIATYRRDMRSFLKLTATEAFWLTAPDRTVKDFQRFYGAGTVPDADFAMPTWTEDPVTESGFNSKGYNAKGFDRWGFDKDGLNARWEQRPPL